MNEQRPDRSTEPQETVHPKVIRRSRALFLIALCLFGGLLIRILLLQTLDYDRYQKKVLDQITTEASVTAERGNIYDANGVLLAANISTYRVFISPASIASEQSEANIAGADVQYDKLIAAHLSAILGVDYDFVLKQTTYTKYLDRTIEREVDENRADQIRRVIDEYGLQHMVYLQATTTRYYPYSSLASHVLGFTGSDGTGLYGLEYYYNEQLSGTNGRYITARDARGNEMPYEYKEYIEPEAGYHINTTIDVFVQSALEEQVRSAYEESDAQNRAAGIVLNVNTGEVLGMATYPSFDLNDPWTLDEESLLALEESGYASGSEEYAKAKQELLLSMWSNKAITESYIPGSTFKVITASMALEEDVVSLGETLTCTGSLHAPGGHTIHCHKRLGHGPLTFVQGIQQSCNPWLMTVGRRIGTDSFYDYLKAFGYLEKTGIDLPGEGGSLFATKQNFKELDLMIYAFGQNFNVTLIQQITGIATVANGGYLVQPHLVSSVTDEDGVVIKSYDKNIRRQVVSGSVCETVSKILEEGVSGDGGAKNAYVAGYRIAAKTGTSEKKNAGSLGEYVCSTVAYAPADAPQYAVIIIVDEPQEPKGFLYGSTVAAPYVGSVMETILPYLGVEPVYSDSELAKKTVTVPNCIYWTASAARNTYGDKLQIEVVGDPNGVVYRQYPETGTVVEKAGARIILYTDTETPPETVTVPDLMGMTAVAANQELINSGLNIKILKAKEFTKEMSPTVVAQSLPKGTEVPRGTVIEIAFPYSGDEDMGFVEEPTNP